MRIEPTSVHDSAIEGPCVWNSESFSSESEWQYELPAADAASLPPPFAADAARLREELRTGRGFVVVKGLDMSRLSDEQATRIYWRVGEHLGAACMQNVKKDLLYSVRDEGYNLSTDYGRVGVRFSKTTEGVTFHTDSAPVVMGATPDVVALLCLRKARQGGLSALVSAPAVHNVMRAERPEALARLYRAFPVDRRIEITSGEDSILMAPVFTWNGSLQVRYFRHYIDKGSEVAGIQLEEADIEALDYFESVTQRQELQIRFDMQPGEMQFVSNRFILHSRTAFEDFPEPERRRHLIRLWLNLM